MNKTVIFGLLALMVVGILTTTSIVSANRGDYSVQGNNYNEERHELMENAFDTVDYDEWHNLMTEDGRHPRVVDVVTEDNFEIFVQAHEASVSGDYETASALRAELGLNDGTCSKDGSRHGEGRGKGQSQRMQHDGFIDSDNDGTCDNIGSRHERGQK